MTSSTQSAESAASSLKIAEEQHSVFMKERLARADLELDLRTVDFPDNLVETTASRIKLVWTIGIRNVGDRAATRISVNCFAPDDLVEFKSTEAPGASPT